jgi:RHS repeat-associated protein
MSTTAQLSENSHRGFDGLKAALCLASMEAKSNVASGMPVCLRREGIGSRSTGKERDAETGLDYFGARYYSGAEGRFTSPDPLLASGRPSVPQSWNRYSYVRNNPLALVDPSGLIDENSWVVTEHDAEITFADQKVLKINGKESVYKYSLKWKADKGNVMADDGKTKIKASKATSLITATVFNPDGSENQNMSADLTKEYSQMDNSTNCIGTAFADGQFWIQPDQVNNIIKGDGYTFSGTPEIGDIGVYSTKGFDTNKGTIKGDIHHAVTVAAVDAETKRALGVTGKGGVEPRNSNVFQLVLALDQHGRTIQRII